MAYRFIEGITSDVMFEAQASNISKLLEQSGLALFDIVCHRKKVSAKRKVQIKVTGNDERELVYNWLSALLSESDANEMFFSKFEARVQKRAGRFTANGVAYGEKYSTEKSGTVVKGVTYYNFKVEKTKKGFKARVVVDI